MSNFMQKVRHLDNQIAKWMMRHFYFIFFHFVLLILFLFWFVNMFGVIDAALDNKTSLIEKLLTQQSVNLTLIVFLLLMNSFWMLYIFNSILHQRTILKDISYHISKLRLKDKP